VVDGIDFIPVMEMMWLKVSNENFPCEQINYSVSHELNNQDLVLYKVVLEIHATIHKLIRYGIWNP
jgi:hypothetical protein